jgi:hypothetical protein
MHLRQAYILVACAHCNVRKDVTCFAVEGQIRLRTKMTSLNYNSNAKIARIKTSRHPVASLTVCITPDTSRYFKITAVICMSTAEVSHDVGNQPRPSVSLECVCFPNAYASSAEVREHRHREDAGVSSHSCSLVYCCTEYIAASLPDCSFLSSDHVLVSVCSCLCAWISILRRRRAVLLSPRCKSTRSLSRPTFSARLKKEPRSRIGSAPTSSHTHTHAPAVQSLE